jgi:hypothetical protein
MSDLAELYRKYWDGSSATTQERKAFESRLRRLQREGVVTIELETRSTDMTRAFDGNPAQGTSTRVYVKAHVDHENGSADIEFGVPSFHQGAGYRFVPSPGLKLKVCWVNGAFGGDIHEGDFRELESRLFARDLNQGFVMTMSHLKGWILKIALVDLATKLIPAET